MALEPTMRHFLSMKDFVDVMPQPLPLRLMGKM
jgi:hypothetical protein